MTRTTMLDISQWFDEGVKKKATHLIVMCDTFDWEDYPSYCFSEEETKNKIRNPGSMQKVMEVYKLSADKSTQLNKPMNFEI